MSIIQRREPKNKVVTQKNKEKMKKMYSYLRENLKCNDKRVIKKEGLKLRHDS